MNMSKLRKMLGFKTMTFGGGIHPYDSKEATCGKPIVDLPPSEEMVCLLIGIYKRRHN